MCQGALCSVALILQILVLKWKEFNTNVALFEYIYKTAELTFCNALNIANVHP